MTREEALQHFKEQLDIFGGEHAEAIKVAIEVLKQVTGKLNDPEDSFLTADSEACKEQKSKLDLISRQAATSIPIIPKEHRKVFKGEDDAFETGWNEALACVNMLPSADRPRGEWDDIGGVIRWGCSLCHYAYDQKFNFCPNCGAEMRSE